MAFQSYCLSYIRNFILVLGTIFQLLFAELDHIAYKGGKNQQQLYHPIILTGDFNLVRSELFLLSRNSD